MIGPKVKGWRITSFSGRRFDGFSSNRCEMRCANSGGNLFRLRSPLGEVTPVTREYTIEPREKISDAGETGSVCRQTSGDMKPGVPQMVKPDLPSSESPRRRMVFPLSFLWSRARPKSAILISRLEMQLADSINTGDLRSKLLMLRSRWTMLYRWRYARPSQTWRMTARMKFHGKIGSNLSDESLRGERGEVFLCISDSTSVLRDDSRSTLADRFFRFRVSRALLTSSLSEPPSHNSRTRYT